MSSYVSEHDLHEMARSASAVVLIHFQHKLRAVRMTGNKWAKLAFAPLSDIEAVVEFCKEKLSALRSGPLQDSATLTIAIRQGIAETCRTLLALGFLIWYVAAGKRLEGAGQRLATWLSTTLLARMDGPRCLVICRALGQRGQYRA